MADAHVWIDRNRQCNRADRSSPLTDSEKKPMYLFSLIDDEDQQVVIRLKFLEICNDFVEYVLRETPEFIVHGNYLTASRKSSCTCKCSLLIAIYSFMAVRIFIFQATLNSPRSSLIWLTETKYLVCKPALRILSILSRSEQPSLQ